MRKQSLVFHLYGRISSQHDQINNTNQQIYHTAFDFATLFVIAFVLLLSILSFSFIFHLRLRCRGTCQLREFNNLWSVRVLLVLFISHWAINEIIRLPFFYGLTLLEQKDLCKLHVVFSLGFLEPGFLMTLLFIIKESVTLKEEKRSEIGSVLWVLLTSLPTLLLQILSALLKKEEDSFVLVDDELRCRFPLVSSMVFGGFAMVYSVGMVVWCWRVVSMVINKKMKWRINLLGLTVIISLLVQSACLGVASTTLSPSPRSVWYGAVVLGMFVSMAMCAGVAEIVLVIKPIVEALVAANCDWNPVVRWSIP